MNPTSLSIIRKSKKSKKTPKASGGEPKKKRHKAAVIEKQDTTRPVDSDYVDEEGAQEEESDDAGQAEEMAQQATAAKIARKKKNAKRQHERNLKDQAHALQLQHELQSATGSQPKQREQKKATLRRNNRMSIAGVPFSLMHKPPKAALTRATNPGAVDNIVNGITSNRFYNLPMLAYWVVEMASEDKDYEVLSREDFDENDLSHWHNVEKEDMEAPLLDRTDQRWQRLVFFTIGGNTYREGYGQWRNSYEQEIVPEIDQSIEGRIWVELTMEDALLLGNEHNESGEFQRPRTEMEKINTLRTAMNQFEPTGNTNPDWRATFVFTVEQKLQLVKAIGLECRSKQSIDSKAPELGNAGGPRLSNQYHRLRCAQTTVANWDILLAVESQIILKEKAKWDMVLETMTKRGDGASMPKFESEKNIVESHIKILFAAKFGTVIRNKALKKLLNGLWTLMTLKNMLQIEERMNTIIKLVFRHSGCETMDEMKKQYGQIFGWNWIKDNIIANFPRKVSPSTDMPETVVNILAGRRRQIELQDRASSMTSKERAQERFARCYYKLMLPVARKQDYELEEGEKLGYTFKDVHLYILYHASMSMVTPWDNAAIQKVMPDFKDDMKTNGHYNIKLYFINYPWGWTTAEWDILWTKDHLAAAFNNMKGTGYMSQSLTHTGI